MVDYEPCEKCSGKGCKKCDGRGKKWKIYRACPFCKSFDLTVRSAPGGWGWRVYCLSCHASGPKVRGYSDTAIIDAINLWEKGKDT